MEVQLTYFPNSFASLELPDVIFVSKKSECKYKSVFFICIGFGYHGFFCLIFFFRSFHGQSLQWASFVVELLKIATRTFQKTISHEYIAYLKVVRNEMLNMFNMCISWLVVTKYSPHLLTEYKPRECKDIYITFVRCYDLNSSSKF